MTTRHCYSKQILLADGARSLGGVALIALPLAASWYGPIVSPVLGAIALLFFGYGVRALLRHRTCFVVDDRTIAVVHRAHRDRDRDLRWQESWSDIEALRMAFFGNRRRRGHGIMELNMRVNGRRLKLDSGVSEFAVVVAHAVRAAQQSGVALSPATRENVGSIGLSLDETLDEDAAAGWGRPSDWVRSDPNSSDSPDIKD